MAYASVRDPLFGQGRDPVFLSDLGCAGTENELLECPSTPFVGRLCTHGRDVGVRCEGQLFYYVLSSIV